MKKNITLGIVTILFAGLNSNAQITELNGNVGIGEISPSEKLHVVGQGLFEKGDSKIELDAYLGISTLGSSHWLHLNKNSDDNVAIGYNSKANVFLTGEDGGFVGIGTKSPSEKLHVVGKAVFEKGDGKIELDAYLGISTLGSSNWLHLNNYSDNNVAIGLNSKANVFLTGEDGGFVGIGTKSPSEKLHVVGKAVFEKGDSKIELDAYHGISTLGSSHWLHLNRNSDDNVAIGLNSKANVFLTGEDGGFVGIGTKYPKNKLSVNGTIWAKEVKIRLTDAADWVFNDDYNLMSLATVDKYIKENKHLPEIPSAEEFRKEDLKVSEMTNKLLQKIEELTLYTIQQQKEILELKNRLNKVESKN